MHFEPTALPGCTLITPQRFTDERGYFMRVWAGDELAKCGMSPTIAQASMSFNPTAGTLRGMHYQAAPHQEAKLVRCTRGAIYDVCLDLRPDSPTYREWTAYTLSAENGHAMYLPEGTAHGYLTLEPDTEVLYFISAAYAPEAGRGVRYDDPAFGIEWPREVALVNDRDAGYPLVTG